MVVRNTVIKNAKPYESLWIENGVNALKLQIMFTYILTCNPWHTLICKVLKVCK